MAGLLLAAGAVAFESLATPVLTGHRAWAHDPARGEGLLADDSARAERKLLQLDGWWSLRSGITIGEISVDSGAVARWAGPNDIPSGTEGQAELPAQFQLESTFSPGSTLYSEMLRKRAHTGTDSAADVAFGGVIDTVLRSAWDSVADDGNSANLTLAGIELSLTVRGDQRALLVNGYDVLGTILSGLSNQETALTGAPPATVYSDGARAVAASPASMFSSPGSHGGDPSEVKVILEAVLGFAGHPLTIFVTLTYLIMWLTVRVMHALREQRRSYRSYRR